jgi:hypothetical protein
MIKPKRSAAQQVADEADRKALNPVASRQTISDSQAEPEFGENHKRLKADRMRREAADKATDRIMPPVNMPWTPEEENKLRELILGGKSVEAIATLLNRTPLAVRHRASRLKLPLRRIEPRGQRSG